MLFFGHMCESSHSSVPQCSAAILLVPFRLCNLLYISVRTYVRPCAPCWLHIRGIIFVYFNNIVFLAWFSLTGNNLYYYSSLSVLGRKEVLESCSSGYKRKYLFWVPHVPKKNCTNWSGCVCVFEYPPNNRR